MKSTQQHAKQSLQRHLIAAVLLAAPLMAAPMSGYAEERGTTIIGSDESPTVLNVVPWKSRELSVDPWKDREGPSSSILDQVLKPLDRDELRREVHYFNLLNDSKSKRTSDLE